VFVPERTAYVIERFGRYSTVLEPGVFTDLNYYNNYYTNNNNNYLLFTTAFFRFKLSAPVAHK